MPVVCEHAYLFRVSLNAHLQHCHKCPSAVQESKTGFDYCRKIIWPCSNYVIFSSERIDGRQWTDGWKDASTRLFSPPRYNHFCVIKSFGLPHYSTALHFVFHNTLPHSTNRLLILALFPIRAHAFQSNRWYCPKIVLVAVPGEIGCQSPCLIMSYYPLCPQTRERATPVSMWSWSIHNHFPVTTMALSGDSPALQTSHFKKGFGTPSFWPRKEGGGCTVSEGWTHLNSHWHGMHYYIFTMFGLITRVCKKRDSNETRKIFTDPQTSWLQSNSKWRESQYSKLAARVFY